MKNLLKVLGTSMLMLTPLSLDKAEADTHVSYSRSTPNKTVRVEKNIEAYRAHHGCHDDIVRRVDITKTRTLPYSNTTVTVHKECCSCNSCCHSHHYPGKAAVKALEWIFCPRCKERYLKGNCCSCSSSHTTIIQTPYQPSTRTEIIIRETPSSQHNPKQREIYFSLP